MIKTLKHLILILTCITLLSSCKNKGEVIYDYEDVNERKIQWNEIFFPANTGYFVYIYSNNCGHCMNIKQKIINFIVDDLYPTYIVEFDSNIPISNNVDDTIGATNYNDVKIKGTPTLLMIENHILIMNVAGENQISSIIDYYINIF